MFKIGAELAGLKREFEVQQRSRKGATVEFQSQNSLIQVRPGGYVVVEAVAEGNNVDKLLADLKALGLVKAASFGRVVSGLMPITALDKMAGLKSMRFAHPAYKPLTNVGAVTSGGDRAMRSDLARRNADVTGRRSKVGVLSDSYNSRGGAAGGIQSGDLPGPGNPNGFTTPVQVLEDLGPREGIDEGRAMLEIIHDVAPGAQLAFATAFNGPAGFARNILNLQQAGCNIIVDDIGYSDEPFFQDGIIAQAVDSVKRLGVAYFSAAGNSGRNSYEAPFKEGGPVRFGSRSVRGGYPARNAHDFARGEQPADLMQSITIPRGSTFIAVFQYDQPFYSAGDGSSPGAASDLDLFLLSEDSTRIITYSAELNVGRDPYEFLVLTNNGSFGSDRFNLLIDKYEGPAPGTIKYILWDSGTINEYGTGSATCYGHPNAAGAIAVGAASFANTPAFGVTVPLKQGFSSAGGIPILFDPNGNPIAPVARRKPEVVAPDGALTTFFIQLILGQYYFFGTSAAAPHAAGVAALMQEANGGRLSPDAIRETLLKTTVEMETPGFDFNTGYGLIDAEAAVRAVTRAGVRYFALVDTDSQQDVREIREGEELNLSYLPSRNLAIRAQTNPRIVGSVGFDLNGLKTTRNAAPYALSGETNGLYAPLTPPLSADGSGGAYQLSATPYSQPNLTGNPGEGLTVNFRVIENTVLYFQLINVATGASLGTIRDGDVITLAALASTRLNITAVTTPYNVGSVVFDF
ncbi:MAG: S8 family serine peptidase, partial [Ferruginibacter sp.]|nr:S8 family serine peptidase [Cytophagales bacterium]